MGAFVTIFRLLCISEFFIIITIIITFSVPHFSDCGKNESAKVSAQYWSSPPFLISDIQALWRSQLSARVPEYQKIKNGGLDQYGPEYLEV